MGVVIDMVKERVEGDGSEGKFHSTHTELGVYGAGPAENIEEAGGSGTHENSLV